MSDIEMTTAINTAQPSDLKPSRLGRRDINYVPGRDSVGEIRSTLLVVAALISAATFAIGVNPPGGVWQDTSGGHVAGKSVLASQSNESFTMFLFSNSAAFASSNIVIASLVFGGPYYLEIWLAMGGMSFTYGISIASVCPSGAIKKRYLFLAIFLPYIVRATWEGIKWIRKLSAKDDE